MSKASIIAKEKFNAVLNDAGRGDMYCRTNRYAVGKPVGNDLINHARTPTRRRSSAASQELPAFSLMQRLASSQMQRRRSSAASNGSMESMTEKTKLDIKEAMKVHGHS
ncbi:uncharacterized protein BCR38DRAFT_405957 [Pseudomassariella vexata]|uniref:Uncharacterized protein n=1 Tax=Pseudomassariella vexata TaxID=1141098 RepID=A0A1Y2EFI9_9PEZI|nr:uncharacterized protein BCR38DRAFT_405957 [Pseudomassariella vexata]ORY70341.1 hypothetical protein BCR38DRAFT_405957 [Pseudomassariella vexata]